MIHSRSTFKIGPQTLGGQSKPITCSCSRQMSKITRSNRVLEKLENENGHEKVMEKSWKMNILHTVMECCDQSWSFTTVTEYVLFLLTLRNSALV